MRSCTVAAIQLQSGPEPAANLARAAALTRQALDAGADLVVLPENYAGIGPAGRRPTWGVHAASPSASEVVAPLLALSAATNSLIVLGGVPEHTRDSARHYNTCLVLAAGRVVARYRKIHRFDATLTDGTQHTESQHTLAGGHPVLVRAALGSIGLSICYDLRFPELYRALVAAGAELLLVPSAFTVETGRAHWEVLLRARAIESQCFVIAAAQDGDHAPGRRSWGHTLIVDPWGSVIASASTGEAVVVARLDAAVLERTRQNMPVLEHRRLRSDAAVEVVEL